MLLKNSLKDLKRSDHQTGYNYSLKLWVAKCSRDNDIALVHMNVDTTFLRGSYITCS